MNKTNPVVHFDLPAEDTGRMTKFYEDIFGWQTKQLGPEMANYILVTTTETDDKGMIKTPGNINGGISKKTSPDDKTKITIQVDDILKIMEKIKEKGGKILPGIQNPDKPEIIPGVGLFALFVDTEGNTVQLIQPEKM